MDISFSAYVAPANGACRFAAPVVYGSDSTDVGQPRFAPYVLDSTAVQSSTGGAALRFAPLQLLGATTTNDGFLAFPPLMLTAAAGFVAPDIAIGVLQFPNMSVAGNVETMGYGTAQLLMPMSLFASDASTFGHPAFLTTTHAFVADPLAPFNAALASSPPGVVFSQSYGGINLLQVVSDAVNVHDTPRGAFIEALIDLMRASDAYTTLSHALQALSDGMSLRDLASMLYRAQLVDSFIASCVLDGYAQITGLLRDGLSISAAADAKSQILAAIQDGLFVHVTLSTGADTYTAWVMTTETKAMRSYSNWPFNSYAQLGNAQLAAGPEGVYRLGGPADISTVIMGRIRSGLLNFGTNKLKRIDRAYLGYTSTGTLCLRVCAISETGTKVEYTYQMIAQPAGGPVGGRVPVGRGPRSVYWSFELCNDASGSAFELHDISVLPMVLTGRII